MRKADPQPPSPGVNLWTSADHALDYLRRADSIPHRSEGEAALVEFLPPVPKRILDLGTGGGRLLALVKAARPQAHLTGLDFSPAMLATAAASFAQEKNVEIIEWDFDQPLPRMDPFDAVISSFAIHHVSDERKRALYGEVFALLAPGGVFCNLEHVASPTVALHNEFLRSMGLAPDEEDPSNKLLDVETQLRWLREIGFDDVDCHWKWRELALLAGVRP